MKNLLIAILFLIPMHSFAVDITIIEDSATGIVKFYNKTTQNDRGYGCVTILKPADTPYSDYCFMNEDIAYGAIELISYGCQVSFDIAKNSQNRKLFGDYRATNIQALEECPN